ncbi:MAG: AMP-binding protein [Actinobacteria bacterium]|nr:AMP-binding protein [Actinomycetota bacterium]
MLHNRADDAIALIDVIEQRTLTHGQLEAAVAQRADQLAALTGRLAFLGVQPSVTAVIDLLALLTVRSTVALLDNSTPADRLTSWCDAYSPEAMLGFDGRPDVLLASTPTEPMPESVLIPTSGSTGSPKFVRLTEAGLAANARQIIEATRIAEGDRALVHLPLFFSYGLSVLTSHLLAGASVVLSTVSATRPQFAEQLAEHGVTCLPGVPFSLELYRRTRLFSRDLPQLRSVTTSGGRVPPDLIAELGPALSEHGIDFWAMYGQTEASGRITALPPEELAEAPGSVGYPMPGNRLSIQEPDNDGIGEVHVSGPGNMLGYATKRADLASTAEPIVDLDTGDLGRLDSRGRLTLTGRKQRIAKVYGARVSLDDVESQLAPLGVVAAISADDGIAVITSNSDVSARDLERAMGFPPRSIRIIGIRPVPRTASGKIDYGRLTLLAGGTSTSHSGGNTQ